MAFARFILLLGGFLTACFAAPMPTPDPSLHPLGQPVGPGEIQFTLRGAASSGESISVECVYRPYRSRDLKKTRHLGLLGGWIGGNSGELIRVQREEFHSVRQTLTASGPDLTFKASLRDPTEDYAAYQLESVRVLGRVLGTVEFERWFAEAPKLDPRFGLKCDATSLRGVLRPSGLGPQPLRGSPPLWPTLRTVDLEFTPVEVPVTRLFEATAKHHWDGWRQTTPQSWPGGKTTVLRHLGEPTVWREHEYHAFPPSEAPANLQPTPPANVLPGVRIEVYWPEGDVLWFPETQFDADIELIAVPLAKLPPRMRDLLAQSVRLRPGWEPSSLSAQEWKELEDSVPELELPLSIEMAPSGDGKPVVKITRKPGFTEPWICVIAAPYDDHRRFVTTCLRVTPERWTGPLPE
jgi:hypothetical protein